MNNKTILFYINSVHDGGAERAILQLAHLFSKDGYYSVLITSFVDDDEYPIPDGVERISIEQEEKRQSRIGRNISRILALRQICHDYQPVALIAFMKEPCIRAIVATMGLPVKTIVSVRNNPSVSYKGIAGTILGKVLLPMADGCVFQTENAREWFPKRLRNKSTVIFNPVKRSFFEQPYLGNTNDVVSLGRLVEQKNQKMLIDAFARVVKNHPEISLHIYGKGPSNEALQNQIVKLDMQAKITLEGLTTEAERVLSKARLFILSSDYEGMPNALMEALAVGVPCISTDCPCGGPRCLIQDGVNGILVPVGDENALVTAIERVVCNSDEADNLGKMAKSMAEAFHPDYIFQLWREYVERVIKG